MTLTHQVDPSAQEIAWLLDRFVADTAGVAQTVVVSADGLLMAASRPFEREEADRLSAVISGLTSLALSASRLLHRGPLRQVILEFGRGYFLVSAISGGSCLGVVTTGECDLGLVGYESIVLVQRIGPLLTPDTIADLRAGLPL